MKSAFDAHTSNGRRVVADTVDVSRVVVDPAWALRVPVGAALRRGVLPLCELDGDVLVAHAGVPDDAVRAHVERFVGRSVRLVFVDGDALRARIRELHGDLPQARVEAAANDPVALFDEILHAAVIQGASDVHVAAERDGVHVALRVDGVLEPYRVLPTAVHAELTSRIKVLSGMDIAERRSPQDGRFTHHLANGREVHLRVATLPTPLGERATIRLLGLESGELSLEDLGMEGRDLAVVERALGLGHGMILATGPTGSGKTTTLHAILRRIIGRRRVNAIAVQDPVEYEVPGVTQVEIDSAHKLGFPAALRSILRHDPDVILVGEIRDRETAELAVQAALTGHLVLSTLHTNSSVDAVTRLIDIGVPGYLVAATLRVVVAQRLVRRLCPDCRRVEAVTDRLARDVGVERGATAHEPTGCVYCAGRGYAGRAGLFEVLQLDEDLAELANAGERTAALREAARERGLTSLRDDLLRKLRAGTTSATEGLSVLGLTGGDA